MTARIAELTGGRGVDLVYDPVGGDLAAEAVRGLARRGRVVVMGLASGSTVPLDPLDLLLRDCSAVGVLAGPDGDPVVEAAVWDRLLRLADSGAIRTPLGTVHAFADVPAMIAGRKASEPGKSVVRVTPA
ncbi:zinc-binding dehydrogenase [Streptomyces sp. NPDC006743]|uniref:zinc-binding dehydrogenase n=1 Tax=Streptomyces sp. NPDC006743 TaxID=3154480 RepID=UPI003453776F